MPEMIFINVYVTTISLPGDQNVRSHDQYNQIHVITRHVITSADCNIYQDDISRKNDTNKWCLVSDKLKVGQYPAIHTNYMLRLYHCATLQCRYDGIKKYKFNIKHENNYFTSVNISPSWHASPRPGHRARHTSMVGNVKSFFSMTALLLHPNADVRYSLVVCVSVDGKWCLWLRLYKFTIFCEIT